MGMRDLITEKPKMGYSIAGGLIAIAIITVAMGGEDRNGLPDNSLLWYVDLNTSERFEVPRDAGGNGTLPPQVAPSGSLKDPNGPMPAGAPAGVRLFVFACDDCSNEQFEGYLQTMGPRAREAYVSGAAEMGPNQPPIPFHRSRIGEIKWEKSGTVEYEAIHAEARTKCAGKRMKRCEPNNS
jgi:hypothetical protein